MNIPYSKSFVGHSIVHSPCLRLPIQRIFGNGTVASSLAIHLIKHAEPDCRLTQGPTRHSERYPVPWVSEMTRVIGINYEEENTR